MMATDSLSRIRNDDEQGHLERRTLRAIREHMSVLDGEDLYQVVSESGSAYHVDLREPACTCLDFQQRDVECKHIRRVQIETGERSATQLRDRLHAAIRKRQREIKRLEAAVQDLETTVTEYQRVLERLEELDSGANP